jgi:hypothetical protein
MLCALGRRHAVADDIVQRLAREHDFRVFTASDDLPGITMMSEAERRQEAATEIERLRTALEVAADHMSISGAPQTTIDAIRNAVRGG